jgi:predicted amidohydrolase
MKITLLQEKHNRLYDFQNPGGAKFSFSEAEELRNEMIVQNFALVEKAGGTDFIVSSEAINFPGPPDRLLFPAWDLVNKGYKTLVERLAGEAARKNAWFVTGLYRPMPDGVLRNSALVFNRKGEIIAVYDKVHLAGSEYVNIQAGDSFCIVDTEFGKIGVCICWDIQFPETCRILALYGVRLVLCPTWGWETIYANCRAYENAVYVAAAMAVPLDGPIQGLRTPSGVIAPSGLTITSAGTGNAEVLVCDIDLQKNYTARAERLAGRRPDLYGMLVELDRCCNERFQEGIGTIGEQYI